MRRDRTELILIDPQNDFCDISGAALPVAGAAADLDRLARLIDLYGERIEAIHVTLDCHHPVDVAHPTWWCDAAGRSPAPFTVIAVEDVASGRWRARDRDRQDASMRYVRALEEKGRYQLLIWPEHCLIGGWGNAVYAPLAESLNKWARRIGRQIDYVFKGLNPATEHYSAIEAEVPDENDPATSTNRLFIDRIRGADRILVAGEALSHCVAGTVRDIAEHLGADAVHKLVLLTDCSSPVPGFEEAGRRFVAAMAAKGMRLQTSDAVFDPGACANA